jgi:hypothetical protein
MVKISSDRNINPLQKAIALQLNTKVIKLPTFLLSYKPIFIHLRVSEKMVGRKKQFGE